MNSNKARLTATQRLVPDFASLTADERVEASQNVQRLIDSLAEANRSSREALVHMVGMEPMPTLYALYMIGREAAETPYYIASYVSAEAAAESLAKSRADYPSSTWELVEYAPIPF